MDCPGNGGYLVWWTKGRKRTSYRQTESVYQGNQAPSMEVVARSRSPIVQIDQKIGF